MKKILFTLTLLAGAISLWAEPFYVRVNGTDDYLASPTGQADFQGRTQYAALCVALNAGDLLTCYDAGSGAAWNIGVIDQYGAFANFAVESNALKCNAAGTYNIYIKMKFEDDMWYIEQGTDCTEPVDPSDPTKPIYSGSVPAQYPGVMLQAFYWDSYEDKGHGRTKWIDLKNQAAEMGQWFDLVWLPPCSRSTGGTGYLPVNYSNLDSDWGTKTNLLAVISTLHANGCRVVADIVVNHVAGTNGWCTLSSLNFGTYGQFSPDMSWICSSDEAFTGGHCTGAGGADDGYGNESNYEAGRDWCHSKAEVRDMVKAYLKWLRNDIGFDGWRYDYCKGFHNSHVGDYNTASEAFFSVMEYWDGNPDVLVSRLNDAGWNTATFDFGVKYAALNQGIAAGNYAGCKGAGLLGKGKSRYSVTFVDSHDSYQRDENEFMGKGNSMKNYDDKTLQANAYILSMPGTPCITYPHWVTWKNEIKAMINARYKAGVHSESAVSDEAGNGYYKATITGTNGSIRLLLGPNSGYNTTPSGYTLAAKGTNWAVYYTENSPRGSKDSNRTPLAVEDLEVKPASVGEKIYENGQIYLLVDGEKYTVLGQKVK